MNLTDELKNLQQKLRDKHPEEVKKVMDKVTNDLMASDIVEKGIKVGDQMPNFCLPNPLGEKIELQNLLQKNIVILSFYRGGWCPYCNLELRKLQQYLPKFQSHGATLVAISPETPDNSLSTQEKNELSFEVLSDVGNHFAKKLGLVFTLPETLRPIYENFGIDLVSYNGDNSFELPIPATYVVTQNSQVVQASINVDYTKRLDPESILLTLKKVSITS